MKVLVLGKFYPPVRGGIETHLQDLALAIGSEHEVTFLVHNEGPSTVDENRDGVRLVRAGTLLRLLNQPISPAMFGWLRRLDPDVIHLHAPNAWTTLVVLLTGGKRPLIISHHADILGREPARSLVLWGYRRMARRARAIVVGAGNNRLNSRDLVGVDAPGRIIPFCIEPSPFEGEPGFVDAAMALRFATLGDGPIGIFIGRLVPYKGADRMIAALAMTPGLKLVIIGGGAMESALRNQAQELGVSERIHWTGSCNEREKNLWLAAADFLVLPSVTVAEAFGLVQVEAMLWSKAVVTTNLPSGVPEVGTPNETTLVVPPDDVPALAAAMRRLSDDKSLRTKMGMAGRARALALYGRRTFARAFLELFDEFKA